MKKTSTTKPRSHHRLRGLFMSGRNFFLGSCLTKGDSCRMLVIARTENPDDYNQNEPNCGCPLHVRRSTRVVPCEHYGQSPYTGRHSHGVGDSLLSAPGRPAQAASPSG